MAGRVQNTTGRDRRRARVKNKLRGSSDRPRLSVFRSNKHMYAQLVENLDGRVIASASTLNKDLKDKVKKEKKSEAAEKVGQAIGKLAKEKGVTEVVFDRSGYLYHGRVRALADGARKAGLKF
jgi:large subunit ribosomal protein L18